jgi:PAS domain S-box-containing protein
MECQQLLTPELERFSASFDDCFRHAGPQDPAAMPLEYEAPGGLPAWLERSLSEVAVGTWQWDVLADRVVWSTEMYRLYGILPDGQPMTNTRFSELLHPDDRMRVNAKLQECMKLGITCIDEFRVVNPRGEIIWIYSVSTIECDASGRVLRVDGINQDITPRRLAEQALRESRAREHAKAAQLEAILDSVPALIWVSEDPECREVRTSSRYGYEFLRMEKGDNLSKSAPLEERILQPWKNVKDGREIPADELPMQLAARTGRETRNYEFDICFQDGETRHLLGNAIPLFDEPGNPSGAIGAFIDITERKRAEDELHQSMAREKQRAAELQAILDSVPSPIFLTRDKQGMEITGNLAAYQIMRVEPGSNLSRLKTRELPPHIRQSLNAGRPITPEESPLQLALKTGKTVLDYEWRLEFDDGSHAVLWGNATPIRDEAGEITGAVSVFIDISARAAVEEELRRTSRRAAFRLALRDALRPLTDPAEIKRAAAEVLGKELGATRAFYASILPGGEEVTLEPGYADEVPVLSGHFRLADFSRDLFSDHLNGRPYMISDVASDPKLSESQRSAYLALHIQSHLDVPLIKNNEIVYLISVEQSSPRQWSDEEISMVMETADRTWANVERARAEAAFKESEARLHASIESLIESLVIFSSVRELRSDGQAGEIIDFRYEYVNEAACKLARKTREEMLGHTLLEVLPAEVARALLPRYAGVVETGQPLAERAAFGTDGEPREIFDIRAVRLGDGLVVTRADVTEQVRAENERRYALTQMEIHHRLAEQSERERQSYARELHDGPIQLLASMAYNLQYIKETFTDPGLHKELEQLGSSLRSAIQDLRQVINELRPPTSIQLGLARAIRLHAEDIQDRSPRISWAYKLADDGNLLSPPVCLAMFRIYQEAVSNIVRHSEATNAWIDLRLEDDRAVLEIQDNGKGLPEKRDLDTLTRDHHFGMAGMSERAEEIGSKLLITSEAGRGTKIEVSVPFTRSAARSKSPTVPRRR